MSPVHVTSLRFAGRSVSLTGYRAIVSVLSGDAQEKWAPRDCPPRISLALCHAFYSLSQGCVHCSPQVQESSGNASRSRVTAWNVAP